MFWRLMWILQVDIIRYCLTYDMSDFCVPLVNIHIVLILLWLWAVDIILTGLILIINLRDGDNNRLTSQVFNETYYQW